MKNCSFCAFMNAVNSLKINDNIGNIFDTYRKTHVKNQRPPGTTINTIDQGDNTRGLYEIKTTNKGGILSIFLATFISFAVILYVFEPPFVVDIVETNDIIERCSTGETTKKKSAKKIVFYAFVGAILPQFITLAFAK